MGVARFYKNIITKYKNVLGVEEQECSHFYIDFNAIIYDVLNNMSGGEEKVFGEDVQRNEDLLIVGVVKYLEKLMKIVNPSVLMYISIDGPCPMAKMIRQRQRRYKSIIENNYKETLERKYNTKIITNKWSTASISPGTIFMDKLCKNIMHCLKNLKVFHPTIVFYLNDCYVPGEGEHKIMTEIKKLPSSDQNKIIVMSPDADLIVLSLMTNMKNIFILRKDTEGEDKDFVYLSIDKCAKEFYNELMDEEIKPNEQEIGNYLMDFVFLTFLCGNDFVLGAQFLKMKERGLDILIKIYKEHKKGQFLIEKNVINLEFFKEIVCALKENEQGLNRKIQQKIHRVRKGLKNEMQFRPEDGTDPNREKEEQWQIDYKLFQHEEYFSPSHPQFEKYNKLFDKIDYYKDDWIDKYNDYFKLDEQSCKNYYDSLTYCLNYYVNPNNIDFSYYYKYRAPPTFNDLYNYMQTLQPSVIKKVVRFSEPFTPFEQLMMILPKELFYLLPKPIQIQIQLHKELDPYYMFDGELEVVYGQKYIYSEIHFQEFDPEIIVNFIKGLNFSVMEKGRNSLKNDVYKI